MYVCVWGGGGGGGCISYVSYFCYYPSIYSVLGFLFSVAKGGDSVATGATTDSFTSASYIASSSTSAKDWTSNPSNSNSSIPISNGIGVGVDNDDNYSKYKYHSNNVIIYHHPTSSN